MTRSSVGATSRPGQGELVPERMTHISTWNSPDQFRMHLYIDKARQDGRLVATKGTDTVVAAVIAEASTSFTAAWTGELSMPWPWLNAQRACAHSKYAEHQR